VRRTQLIPAEKAAECRSAHFQTQVATTKDKRPSGKHAFDVACAGIVVEHRLAPPRHPQTNGMVERFNGRIAELLQQTRFDSAADLAKTLQNYLKLYNHHIPQRAIGSKTPVQALKEWQRRKPDVFVKRVYHQTGLDSCPTRCSSANT
jgi:transposase InsO family protein